MNKLPPGPRSALLQTVLFARDNYSHLAECARRYGDPFTLPTLLGPSVVTGDPEGVKEIFSADPELFEPWAKELIAPVGGDNTMVLLTGPRHKRERKLFMPAFHGARMRSYAQIIQDVTRKHVASLAPGQRFLAQDITMAVSMEVIFRAVFGVQSEERMREMKAVLERAAKALKPLMLLVPALQHQFGGYGPWASFTRAQAEVHRMFVDVIRARRQDAAEKEDILSLMLGARDEAGQGMTEIELRDELITLLSAGHETTATSLAWALYFVHRDRNVAQKLDAELAPLGAVPSPETLAGLPYLGAVCDEALRIRPIIPVVNRKLKAPFTLRGYTLPAGIGVVAAAGLAHFNPITYPDPQRFYPERFLDRKFTPFEYLPYGGGARRCLGAAFASYEMKIVLGTILAGQRLALVREELPAAVNRHFAISPQGGVEMRLVERRANQTAQL